MKKISLFSKIIFTTVSLFSLIPLTLVNAQSAEVFGPSALYKEESYTFVLDRNQNIYNSDSTINIYIYNPKLEIAFSQQQVIDQTNLEPFYFNVPENTLKEGDYFISVEVVDNLGKSRIIAQKNIGVLSNGKTWVTKNKEALLSFFAFIIIISLIHHIARDREIYTLLKRVRIVKKKAKKVAKKKTITKRKKLA